MSDKGSGRGLRYDGLWIASVPADHACRTITGADEMKSNYMDAMSVAKEWNEICVRENGRNTEKNLPRPRFVHHETHKEVQIYP